MINGTCYICNKGIACLKKLTAFLLTLTFSILNQADAQSYYFKRYQVDNGLSHNTVFCTLHDKKGFFWAGTKDGLNRFDGSHFRIFRNNAFDSINVAPNFILSLFEDDQGILWIGTQHGLYKYDEANERFHLLKGSRHGDVRDIQSDNQGNLWFISGAQLYCYPASGLKQGSVEPFHYFDATSVCKSADGTIWVATSDGFIKKYNTQKRSFLTFDVFNHSSSTTSKWIDDIFDTGKGYLFIGTSTQGIKRFNMQDGSYKDLLVRNTDQTEIFVRDFVQYNENEYWIATESGIYVYNWADSSFRNIKKEFNNPYSLSDNAVYALCKDQEGGIWAGTYFGGVDHYTKVFNRFEKYFPQNNKNSIQGNAVREICSDDKGDLWIGTEDGGLNCMNRQTSAITHFNPTGNKGSISYFNIHTLLPIGNRLWIGTFEHGLDLMDINSGKVIRHYDAGPGSFHDNFIVTMFRTKEGTILAGTSFGLYRYDSLSDRFMLMNIIPSNCFVHAITQDHEGTIWIGTINNGAFFFNPETGVKGNFMFQEGVANNIKSNLINNIFEDSNGYLWFATEGEGLTRYDRKNKSFRQYSTADGLPSDFVLKILEDNNKNLWITTTKGLVCLNPTTQQLKVFTKSNGLLTDQFNYNSGYKDAQGRLYFGCVKGMISFNPSELANKSFIPPVYITSMQIDNKDIDMYSPGSPFHTSVTNTKAVQLSHDQSSFSLDFAALSFASPETVSYAYKLEGLDKDWIYLKNNRKVYFTDLSPGTYTFRVKSTDSNGYWSGHEATLMIEILPPFWQSNIAYTLYIVFTICIIYLIVRSYHHRTEENHRRKLELMNYEKEKEIYQAKIDFFTNVAHEIRTPLTLIQGPMENVIDRTQNMSDLRDNLRIMEKNTYRLIELTDQLLDFREIETGSFMLHCSMVNITELLYTVYTSFKTLAEQKGIELSISLPEIKLVTWADEDALNKILNNLFSNAIKYAHSKAFVQLLPFSGADRSFTIECANDGFLIPDHLKEKIFEPFFRVKETQKQKGTGLGLSLSRSLAELHNGSLYLKKECGNMNIFILQLPLTEQKEYA